LTDAKSDLSRASRIEAQLRVRLAPTELALEDESARHAGHAGAAPGGETHYRLRMIAAAFEGLSRIDRQRLVNEALRGEFESGLHALSLDLKTPAEASGAR